MSHELFRLDLSHERSIQAVILSLVPTEQSLLILYTYITFPILTSRTIPFKNYTDSMFRVTDSVRNNQYLFPILTSRTISFKNYIDYI